MELRKKLRIHNPFPATVRGLDARGEAFETESVLDNLSASGLYVRLMRRVEQGTKVLTVIQFSTGPTNEATRGLVALRGVVLRAEPQPNGTCGLGVAFTRHRFL